MTPKDAVARLLQLGASLDLADLPSVEFLHICEEGNSGAEYAGMIVGMAPERVTLNGAIMTARDVPALLHFPALQGIVAHRMEFANVLLRHLAEFAAIQSIAMSHTPITDADVAVIANCRRLTSIHFRGNATDRCRNENVRYLAGPRNAGRTRHSGDQRRVDTFARPSKSVDN